MVVIDPSTGHRTISRDAMRQEARIRTARHNKAQLEREAIEEDRFRRMRTIAAVLGIVILVVAVLIVAIAIPTPEGIEPNTLTEPLQR